MITEQQDNEVERIRKLIQMREKRIKRLKAMEDLLDMPAWKALKEDMEFSIEVNENIIDAKLGDPDPEASVDPTSEYPKLKAYRAAANAYKGVIANVEHASDKIAALQVENRRHREYVERMKEISKNTPANNRKTTGRRTTV